MLNKKLYWIPIVAILSACSQQKEPDASFYCAKHYRAESYLVALEQCRTAATAGKVGAQWLLASIFRHGLGVEQNLSESFYWTLEAAQAGHVSAQRETGSALMRGQGTDKNIEEGLKWLRKSADKRDIESSYLLGTAYLTGEAGKIDHASAVYWFKKAVKGNHLLAINNLSWLYATSNNQSLRNGTKAVNMMEILVEEHSKSFVFLDTLAAAYAESGSFEKAVATQNKAVALITNQVSPEEKKGYIERLDAYKNEMPWRELLTSENN